MASRAMTKYFKDRFENAPPREKRKVTCPKDTFQDKTEEELLFGSNMPDPEEREFLLWYARATSPGYCGPDVRCMSSLDPHAVFSSASDATGRRSAKKKKRRTE